MLASAKRALSPAFSASADFNQALSQIMIERVAGRNDSYSLSDTEIIHATFVLSA